MSDAPTPAGAYTVLLNQRSATPPYHREVVEIQGDEVPGRAIGFDGAGVLGAISVGSSAPSGLLNVVLYGALTGAAGAATNKAAIEAAAAAAVAGGHRGIYFPNVGSYQSSLPIVIPKDCDVIMDDELLYTGTANETFLTIGSETIGNHNHDRRMKLSVRRQILSSWSSDLSVGIRIWAANLCRIEVVQIQGFSIGMNVKGGNSSGCQYNEFYLGSFRENRVHIQLSNNPVGWCNANNFYGGSLSYYSSDATSPHAGVGPRIGVQITSHGGPEINNGNNFWGTHFELFKVDVPTVVCRCVVIDHGWDNTFNNVRNEDSGNIFMEHGVSSVRNQYSLYGGGGSGTGARAQDLAFGHQIQGPVRFGTSPGTGTTPFVILYDTTEILKLTSVGILTLPASGALHSQGYVQSDYAGGVAFYAPNGGICALGAYSNILRGRTTIGDVTDPNVYAVLDVVSTTKGFLPPRMTKAQRLATFDSGTPDGMMIYQTDNTPGLRVRENGAWVRYTATADA